MNEENKNSDQSFEDFVNESNKLIDGEVQAAADVVPLGCCSCGCCSNQDCCTEVDPLENEAFEKETIVVGDTVISTEYGLGVVTELYNDTCYSVDFVGNGGKVLSNDQITKVNYMPNLFSKTDEEDELEISFEGVADGVPSFPSVEAINQETDGVYFTAPNGMEHIVTEDTVLIYSKAALESGFDVPDAIAAVEDLEKAISSLQIALAVHKSVFGKKAEA